MAVRKSTRSKSTKGSGGQEIRTHPRVPPRVLTPAKRNASPALRNSPKNAVQEISPADPARSNSPQKAVEDLRAIALRLWSISGVATTVDKALRYQNAAADVDIADTVRHALSGPLFDQIERLDALIVSLGGQPLEDSL